MLAMFNLDSEINQVTISIEFTRCVACEPLVLRFIADRNHKQYRPSIHLVILVDHDLGLFE